MLDDRHVVTAAGMCVKTLAPLEDVDYRTCNVCHVHCLSRLHGIAGFLSTVSLASMV